MNGKIRKAVSLILSVIILIGALPVGTVTSIAQAAGVFNYGTSYASNRPIVAYAVLYNNGDLVFEADDTPDETDKTPTLIWPVEDTDYVLNASEWPWYNSTGAIKKIRFSTVYKPKTTAYMFSNCTVLTEFDGKNLDLGSAMSVQYMFYRSINLETVKNIENWNLSNSQRDSYLFSACSSLKELDLSGWTFRKKSYVSMDNMFNGCTNLRTVGDISKWDAVDFVTDSMFLNCVSLESLDLSGWSNPSSMTNMFGNCGALSKLKLSAAFTFPSNNRDGLSDTWYLNGTGAELSANDVRTKHNAEKAVETYYKYYQNFKARLFTDGRLTVSKDITEVPDEERPQNEWDLSVNPKDGAWPWNNNRGDIKAVSFIDVYCPDTAASMFENCDKLISFDGTNLDLSLAGDMHGMFSGCTALSHVTGIDKWNTKNAADISGLFKNCSALSAISGIKNWNLSSAANMSSAFENTGFTELDLTGWDTSAATTTANMFKDCSALTVIAGMGSFNVSAVTDMSRMFENCAKLQKLDFSSWDTTANPDMTGLFTGCTELEGLTLGAKFRFGESEDGLSGVWQRNDGDGRQLDAAGVRSLHNTNAMLESYTADKPFYAYIDQNGTLFIHQNTENASGDLLMSPLPMPTEIGGKDEWPWDKNRADIRNTDISASYCPPTMAYMFADCVNLGKAAGDAPLKLAVDTRYVTDMNHMFAGCTGLTSDLDLTGLRTEKVTNMESMFEGCEGITSLSSMGLRKGNGGSGAFAPGTFEANGWDTVKVTTMKNMFKGCTALTDISAMREWNTLVLKDVGGLFEDCASLTEMTGVGNWNIGKFSNARDMFKNCTSLAKIDTGEWNIAAADSADGIFTGCTGVRELVLGANFRLTEEIGLTGLWQLDGEGDIFETKDVLESHKTAKKPQTYLKPFYGVLYENGDLIIQRGNAADKSVKSSKTDDWLINVDKTEEPPEEEEEENTGEGEDSGDTEEKPPKPADKPWPWSDKAKEIKSVSFTEQFAPYDTANMFDGCENLTEFNGENFAAWNILDMHAMFRGCAKLALLDVTGWNTSKVTDMSDMFDGCTVLQGINGLNSFNTAAVTKMDKMFNDCAALVDLDLRNFDSALLGSMTDMFAGCAQLKRIVLGANFRMLIGNGLPGSWYLDGLGEPVEAEVIRINHNAAHTTESYFTVSGFYAVFYGDENELVFQVGETPEPGRKSDSIYELAKSITAQSDVPWNARRAAIEKVTFRDKVAPQTTAYWFTDCTKLETITGSSENLNMQNVTDMRSMFKNCTALESLDAEKWNTEKVTNASHAFEQSGLLSLNAQFWNFAVCTDLSYMFANCPSLEEVAADFWDMPKATNLSNMFLGCTNLYNVDISRWNTVSVENLSNLFKGCAKLGSRSQDMNLKAIHTDSVTDMSSAFEGTGFSEIDLSECNTEKVKNFNRVFANCKNLKTLNIAAWTTSGADSMDEMFSGTAPDTLTLGEGFVFLNNKDHGLTSRRKRLSDGVVITAEKLVTLTGSEIAGTWIIMTDAYAVLYPDGRLVIQIGDEIAADADKEQVKVWLMPENVASFSEWPWNDCREEIVSVRFADRIKLNTASWMFGDCTELTSFDGTNLDVGAVGDMSFMFYNCQNLTELKGLSGWNVSKVVTANSMFWLCENLADVSEIKSWNVSSLEDTSSMFLQSGLVTADLSGWITGSLTDISYMFSECKQLLSADLTGWNTSRVTDMSGLFNEDIALAEIQGLDGFATQSVKDMSWMFCRCTNLANVPFSDWATSEVTDMTYMFADSGIVSAPFAEWNTGGVTAMEGMFSGCNKLSNIDASGWNTSLAAAAENGMPDMFYGTSALKTLVLGPDFRFNGDGGEGLTGGWRRSESSDALIPYNRLMKNYSSDMAGTYLREDVYGMLYGDGELVIQYGNTSDGREPVYTYNIGEIDGYESWPWYDDAEHTISSVSFKDFIHFDYLGYMFYGCEDLESFDGKNLDTADVYYLSGMFLDCPRLANVTGLDGWNTSTFIETDDMFSGCGALSGVKGISGWNTDWLELTSGMFADSGVRSLDLSGWKLPEATDISAMFANCTDLETIDISGFAFGSKTETSDLFAGCEALGKIVLGADFRPGTGNPALSGNWRYLGEGDVAEQSGEDLLGNYTGEYPGTYVETGHLSFGAAVLYEDGTLEFAAAAPAGESGIIESVKLGTSGKVSLDELVNKDKIKSVRFDENFLTAGVILPWQNISGLFANLTNLEAVDFAGSDLSDVTDMSRLFAGCAALKSISGLHSGKLTNLSEMFLNCAALESVDLTDIATADEAVMTDMFKGCAPKSLTLGEKFHGQSGTALNVSYKRSDDISSPAVKGEELIAAYTGENPGTYVREDSLNFGYAVLYTDGRLIFKKEPLETLDDTVEHAGYFKETAMAGGDCYDFFADFDSDKNKIRFVSFEEGYDTLPGFCEWTTMAHLFNGFTNLETVDFTNCDLSHVKSVSSLFYSNKQLRSVSLEGCDLTSLNSLANMFYPSSLSPLTALENVSFKNCNTSTILSTKQLFRACSALNTVDFTGCDLSKVTDSESMFRNCTVLTEVKIESGLPSDKNPQHMFEECKSLKSVDIGDDLSKATAAWAMFSGCTALTEVKPFKLEAATDLDSMFTNCSSLKEIDLSLFNTSKVTLTKNMFSGCSSLVTLDISNFDMGNVTSAQDMFASCTKLAIISFGEKGAIPQIVIQLQPYPWFPATTSPDTGGLTGTWRRESDNRLINADSCEFNTLTEDKDMKGVYHRTGLYGTLAITAEGDTVDPGAQWRFTVALSGYDPNTENGKLATSYGGTGFTNGVSPQFALSSGGNKTVTGIPVGVKYTVTELNANADGYTTDTPEISGVIETGATAEAAFLNYKEATVTADLTVTNTVKGSMGNKALDFRYKLTLTNDSSAYMQDIVCRYNDDSAGLLTYEDDGYSFTLHDGMAITLVGIPGGLHYTVTQQPEKDYTVEKTNDVGTLGAENITVDFVNTKDKRIQTAASVTTLLLLFPIACIGLAVLWTKKRHDAKAE